LLMGAVAGVTLIADATNNSASAVQYRWCAVYSGGDHGGSWNCYFETIEQCRATVSGVGGICVPSPFNDAGDARTDENAGTNKAQNAQKRPNAARRP
jgi:hypothetical protein